MEAEAVEAVLFLWKRKCENSTTSASTYCRLFDLKRNLAKKFCPFPNVDQTVKLACKSE